jgi:hypothetical protein
MKKTSLLVFLLFASMCLFSQTQNSYPVQTILKGDSVVIYSVQQSADIDLMLANQRALSMKYRSDIDRLKNELDSVKEIAAQKQQIIDSISKVNYACDSVKKDLYLVKDWILKTSMDNALIYFSWQDSTVRCIDLTVYRWKTNYQTGNLRLVRRGDNVNYELFKDHNYRTKESPSVGWEGHYWEVDRPIVKKFPFDIKINEHPIP